MNNNLTDQQLQTMINLLTVQGREFLKKEFGLKLNIPIKMNGRLKSTLGRFKSSQNRRTGVITPLDIELSKVALYNGYEVSLDILKHELIHYALQELGVPNRDSDREFIQACTERNVTLTRTTRVKQERVIMECDKCNHEWVYNQRRNGYTHTDCGGRLVYVGKRIE